MFRKPAPMPLKTTLSIIMLMGIIPASGLRLSCMLSTEPLEVAVVKTAQVAPETGPSRTSLPSMFGPGSTARPVVAAFGSTSFRMANEAPATQIASITPKTTAACRPSRSMNPNMAIVPIGIRRIATSSIMLLQGEGFSNGCVELGPK